MRNTKTILISFFVLTKILVAGFLVLMAGCTSPYLSKTEAGTAFNGARLVSVVDPAPTWGMTERMRKSRYCPPVAIADPIAMAVSCALWPLCVVMLEHAEKEGKQFAATTAITDPAQVVRKCLAERLGAQYTFAGNNQWAEPWETKLSKSKLAEFARAHSFDVALEVETIEWLGMNLKGKDSERCPLTCTVEARIVRGADKKLLAAARSQYTEKTTAAATHGQLLADNAALLKFRLKQAAEWCASDLENQLVRDKK